MVPARSPTLSPVLAVALVLSLLILRRPDALQNPQFWAEDATIFFRDADIWGAKSLWQPYAGYLHFTNRVVAWLVACTDVCLAPLLYNLGAAGLTAFTAARFLSPRLALPFPWLFAASIVAVPHTGEVFFNLTNSQWITAVLLVQLVFMRAPIGRGDYASDTVAIALAALAGPFSTLLLPLFILRAWREVCPGTVFWCLSVATAAAVQAWLLWHAGARPAPPEWAGFNGVVVLLRRSMGTLLFGRAAGIPAATWIALGVTVVLAVRLRVRDPHTRWRRGLWAVLILLLLPVVAVVRVDHWHPADLHNGDRYFYLPKLILLWLLLLELRAHHLWARGSAAALLALVMASTALQFRAAPLRDLEWSRYAARLHTGRPTDIPVNPDWVLQHPGRAATRCCFPAPVLNARHTRSTTSRQVP